tara:strand:+ start:33 stop:353 length:321 start_codon:yes stop_codon:yes gene_type:complete
MTNKQQKKISPCFFPIISKLRTARINKGISQEELGYKIGLAEGYLSKWERGERTPSLFSLICWAETLQHQIVAIPMHKVVANDNGEFIANDNRVDELAPMVKSTSR